MSYRAIFDQKGLLAEFENGECVWLRDDYGHGSKRSRTISSPMVIRDIEPYKSMLNGEMVTSRRRHRELLSQYGGVEIGNDIQAHMTPPPKPQGPSRKETLHRMLADDDTKGLQKLIKRTVKELKQ